VCSISINSTTEQQLEQLNRSGDGDRERIEKRLFQLAKESDVNVPGPLDRPNNSMKGMPLDLKDIKKYRIGRHRVFYKGNHRNCSFSCVYIKLFKKNDVNRENDKKFQKILSGASNKEVIYKIGN
jgi:hypothetical protein